jgi:hypothetical protein
MAPLKPGDIIYSKSKPHRKGTIQQASGVGGNKHEWVVEFEEDGATQTLKSQQLLRKKPQGFPANESSTATNAHLPDRSRPPPRCAGAVRAVPLLEGTDVSTSSNNEEDGELQRLPNMVERLDLDSDDDSDDDEDKDDIRGTTGSSNGQLLNDSLDREDPFAASDDEEEENNPPLPPDDYIPAVSGAAVDSLGEPIEEDFHSHGEIDIEPENVHKVKWEKYLVDKTHLLTVGWSVAKTGTNGGISNGAIVRTKARANQREGEVVGQTQDGEGKKVWLVNFGDDGEAPEPMRPQKLMLVTQNAEEYVWDLVEDSEPEPETVPGEYSDGIGLCGFDFTEAFAARPVAPGSNKVYEYPYLKLLQKMWPGDWRHQLRQLNIKVAAENLLNSNNKNRRDIHLVSEQEWWVFIGVLISAGPQGKGGNKLWERPSHRESFGITHRVNYGPKPDGLDIMAEYRFKDIKACFPWSFQDTTKADEDDQQDGYDPWHMVLLLVDGYNANRRGWLAASVRKTLDESMCAYRPRTSKTGGWPNISYILRKPEPLGTEFKVIACSVTGKLAVVSKCHGCSFR